MKNIIIAAVAGLSLFAGNAFADGFVCQNEAGDLKAKVFNHTQPEEGTRNAAVMILSNPQLQSGNKTIARFRAPQTLTNEAATYLARVDLRFNDHRAGEYLAGTRLGYVKNITLAVDFSYAAPVEEGTETSALMTVKKRNGDTIKVDMVCARYLAN